MDLKQLTVDQTQQEIIVGSLLGDAYMESTTRGATWRLGIEHGEKQKMYVDKKYEILCTLSDKMEKPRLKIGLKKKEEPLEKKRNEYI